MLYEHWTMRNIFSAFGGADEFSYVREGKVRCQGPFRHPILAGMMGATVMPFIVWQWWREKRNSLPLLVSFAASAAITYAASSSGALLTFIYEILAFSLWFIRDRMKMVRWSIVVAIIGLDFAMTAPIWYVFARLSSITGGTGWHRAYLLERAFGDIERWWFAGTAYTADWFPYILEADANNADITNMFLVQGVTAGMITMILFIMIIVQCYKYIGAGLKALNPAPFPERFLLWTLGVVLFGHIAGFFSVSYFDQMNGMWYLILAMISSAGSFLKTAIVIEDDQPVMIEGT
jgi:hypothetical protein